MMIMAMYTSKLFSTDITRYWTLLTSNYIFHVIIHIQDKKRASIESKGKVFREIIKCFLIESFSLYIYKL